MSAGIARGVGSIELPRWVGSCRTSAQCRSWWSTTTACRSSRYLRDFVSETPAWVGTQLRIRTVAVVEVLLCTCEVDLEDQAPA
jgi:hypothetical protein